MIHIPTLSVITACLLTGLLAACATTHAQDTITITSMSPMTLTDPADKALCESFHMNKQDVAAYFQHAKVIDSVEFQRNAIVVHCQYSGTMTRHGQTLHWLIHAGGVGHTRDAAGQSVNYLCVEHCCKLAGDHVC